MVAEAEAPRWVATERQREVLQLIAQAPEGSTSIIGYGGAAGGAKTNLQANLAIELALGCPGSQTLVGRQDFVDLRTTTLAEFDAQTPVDVQVERYNSAPVYRKLRLSAELPWSTVYFRQLKDWQSILSDSFGFVLIDEGQETEVQAILGLLTRLRHKPEKKWGLVVTFNPFPSWCVEWFMRRKFTEATEAAFARGNVHLHFVPSRISDNPHLRAGYQEMLEATLDPYMKAVMVDGDPEAALGGLLYFDRESLKALEVYATPALERRETRAAPDALADGEVLIWERPLTGERYYAGADTADGKGEAMSMMPTRGGSDRNAAAIYRARDNVQVAAIYGRQEEHQFARVLNEYGRWYNNALLAVERNRRPVLIALRELEYPNLYRQVMPSSDTHVLQRMGVQTGMLMEYGWLTDLRTRPILLGDYREALSMRAPKPRDAEFFREAENFIGGIKPQAAAGQHDDRVFAHAVAWQARKSMVGLAPGAGTAGFSMMTTTT